jgi:NAD(P)-dependent dehydrogenase (short-subunit alcohol dehydrogenase family)
MPSDVFRPDLLAGMRAMVTGGSRGIGAATIRQLAAMGAEVVIADVNLTLAEELAGELAASGTQATAVGVDLTDRDATAELGRQMGALDILVNNAAPRQTNGDFLEMSDADWELQFAVILWAPIVLTREIGKAMRDAGKGSIVNISSVAVRNPTGFVAPYATAKSALETLTRITATELGPSGVRCNAVAPTFVPTERNRPSWQRVGYDESTGLDSRGRALTTPEDIAEVVAWVASPAAAHVNGEVIVAR